MWNEKTDMAPETAEPGIETQRHIGEDLRIARIDAGVTHSEISETLKIQSVFLDAIERLDLDALPSIGYVLGYVRAYALHLGMDGKEAVERYKADVKIPENLGMRSTPHFVPKRQIRLPRGFFAAVTMVCCASVVAFWYGFQTDAQSAALPTQTGLSAANTSIAEPEPIDPDLMTFKAIAPTWVQIKDQFGNSIISRILVTGETWETGIYANVSLSARDSGALELYIGGELMGRLGKKGIPMADIPMPAVPREFAVSLPDSVTAGDAPADQAATNGTPEPVPAAQQTPPQ